MKRLVYFTRRIPEKNLFITLFLCIFISTPAAAITIDLAGTIRDFQESHLDFEDLIDDDLGIVQNTLGADKKPVYAGVAGNPTTHGQAAFDQWYRDVPGVNMSIPYTITLDNSITPDPNVYSFSDMAFFPIDGQGFGNQGRLHNYHFTFEIHSEFTYQGGESFAFTGDDDLWLFIDNQLVIDLGGVHPARTGGVGMDTLGLTIGNNYDFDLFFAERHSSESNFNVETSIPLDKPIPEPATMLLVGTGLVGLAAYSRKKSKKSNEAQSP